MEDVNSLGILAYRVYYICVHIEIYTQREHTKTEKEKKKDIYWFPLIAPYVPESLDKNKTFEATKCHPVYICMYI